jgi:hypothetical protein
MSHFAKVVNGIVEQVIVAEQDVINSGLFGDPKQWVQTSYNTRGGKHYNPQTGVEDTTTTPALRGNYAGIGHTYDATNDVFYAPRPTDRNGVICNSFTISAPTWQWVNPVPMPSDAGKGTPPKQYAWDEPTKSWVVVVPKTA